MGRRVFLSYIFQLLIATPGLWPAHISPGFLIVRLAEWKQGRRCGQGCGAADAATRQVLQTRWGILVPILGLLLPPVPVLQLAHRSVYLSWETHLISFLSRSFTQDMKGPDPCIGRGFLISQGCSWYATSCLFWTPFFQGLVTSTAVGLGGDTCLEGDLPFLLLSPYFFSNYDLCGVEGRNLVLKSK